MDTTMELDDLKSAWQAIDRRLELVVLQVRTEQEHEFVSAHGPGSPLSGFAALTGGGAAERWDTTASGWEARGEYSRGQAPPPVAGPTDAGYPDAAS